MATTTYLIITQLEFDSEAKRNTVYNKMKTALANAKTADAWVTGFIKKGEKVTPTSSEEDV